MYISDVEKIGETDFVEKPKSIYGTPLGKWLYPKSKRVAMRLILGGRVTYSFSGFYFYFYRSPNEGLGDGKGEIFQEFHLSSIRP